MPITMGCDPSGLEAKRKRIDELDRKIVDLLNARAKVVVEIGRIKIGDQAPIYAPDREQTVLEQVRRHNRGPLPDSCVEAVWRELMSGSFALERPLRIGYLGPAGSFSPLAARLKFGASVGYDDMDSIRSVFDAMARGRIDLGLVPIENSSHGGIGETLDCFLETPARVCAEVLVAVRHNLLANCELDQIKRVYSKPEALSQCRGWLSANLRDVEQMAAASTSSAAELAAGSKDGGGGDAAIASRLAAEIYGVRVLCENIEDNPNNVTRFFVISSQSARSTGYDKTAIMFTTAHVAGALANVLDTLREHGLNLTHIDKRPSKRVNWEYYFFVDFEGHESDQGVARAIEAARAHCLHLTVLGSFPLAREVI